MQVIFGMMLQNGKDFKTDLFFLKNDDNDDDDDHHNNDGDAIEDI